MSDRKAKFCQTLTAALLLVFAAAASAGDKVLSKAQWPGIPGAEIAVVMRAGKTVSDTQAWCGSGKFFEGRFLIRVKRAGMPVVETELAPLLGAGPDEPLAFPARPWPLAIRDYRGSGQPEFTIGQYGNCNGWRYRILSIRADGHAEALPLAGLTELFVAARQPSVGLGQIPGGFIQRYYDNTRAQWVQKVFRWDAAQLRFAADAPTK